MKRRILSSVIVAVLVFSITTVNVLAADWVRVYRGSEDVFWGQNASIVDACAATIQGMIEASTQEELGIQAPHIGVASIIATVAIMAYATTGCRITTEIYTFTIPGQPVHYMYKYWFVDSNGKEYGPITIQPNPYSPNSEDDVVTE